MSEVDVRPTSDEAPPADATLELVDICVRFGGIRRFPE